VRPPTGTGLFFLSAYNPAQGYERGEIYVHMWREYTEESRVEEASKWGFKQQKG
jgi:hypothetical protein